MSSRPLTVLHTSDYQIGSPYLPAAADAMIRLADDVAPDVIVAAGDLTQRAKRSEFKQATELLERFGDVPIVTTPGNHDVPLYRGLERLAIPFRNWRRFSGRSNLDSVTRVDGATFVALSSAAPHRAIVDGHIATRQVEFAGRAFDESPVHDHRIVVIHHHFIQVEGGGAGRTLGGAVRLLRSFEEMGVSAILGGHVHQIHLRTSTELTGSAAGVPVLSAGTATSRRGRGEEAGANSLCVLRFEHDSVDVVPYLREPDATDFEALDSRSFELGARVAHVPDEAVGKDVAGP